LCLSLTLFLTGKSYNPNILSGRQLVATAKSSLDFYRACMLLPNSAKMIETDTRRGMVAHYDCIWIAHWCLVTGPRIRYSTSESAKKEESQIVSKDLDDAGWDVIDDIYAQEEEPFEPAFIDLVSVYQRLAAKYFNNQIV
jgi:hypothetical protein